MANSKLIGKKWKIPKQYLKILKGSVQNYNGDKHVTGYTRLVNLIKSGVISYENLKNIKHILEKYKSNEDIYNLNGGDAFYNWINNTLKVARTQINNQKKVKKETGINNTYKKGHTKDNTKLSRKISMPKINKSVSHNDISNGNVNYENIKITKVIITEQQYKKL